MSKKNNAAKKSAPASSPAKPKLTVTKNIETKLLEPSPLNPRKTLGPIDDVRDSIAQVGLLSPLLVRPHPKKYGRYEIVCGHRRFAAAKELKLTEIACGVRDLSDREAIECMLVENTARADVPPLEEAEAFAALHTAPHNLPVAEIATRTGKSEGHVYERIRMAQKLSPKVKKALADGKILVGVALLLARLEDKKDQEEALDDLVSFRYDGEPAGIGQAKREVSRYLRVLKHAPFDTTDATLVPAAGACTTCPKRTDKQAALFADADDRKNAKCIDGGCWTKKEEAKKKRAIEDAKARGLEVVKGKAADKIVQRYGGGVKAGFIDLDAVCSKDGHGRTWREVLKKEQPPPIVVENPHRDGEVLEVVKESEAFAAAKKLGARWAQPVQKTKTDEKEREKKRKLKEKQALELATEERKIREVSNAVEQFPGLDRGSSFAIALLMLLRELLLDKANQNNWRTAEMALRRGFTHPDLKAMKYEARKKAQDFIENWIEAKERTVGELLGLAFEFEYGDLDERQVDELGKMGVVDFAGLEARARQDLEREAVQRKAEREAARTKGKKKSKGKGLQALIPPAPAEDTDEDLEDEDSYDEAAE